MDLIFIPLRKNDFNKTSENYNKMLEAGLFNIPVMVTDMFPYNQMIKDAQNGIILKDKKDFILKLEHFLTAKHELKRIGLGANQFIKQNFLYSEMTIGIYDDILS